MHFPELNKFTEVSQNLDIIAVEIPLRSLSIIYGMRN